MTLALILAALLGLSAALGVFVGRCMSHQPGPRPRAPWLPEQRDGSDR